MSVSGSPETAIRSANNPALIGPRSLITSESRFTARVLRERRVSAGLKIPSQPFVYSAPASEHSMSDDVKYRHLLRVGLHQGVWTCPSTLHSPFAASVIASLMDSAELDVKSANASRSYPDQDTDARQCGLLIGCDADQGILAHEE